MLTVRAKQLEVIDYCWILHTLSSADMHVPHSAAMNTNTQSLPKLIHRALIATDHTDLTCLIILISSHRMNHRGTATLCHSFTNRFLIPLPISPVCLRFPAAWGLQSNQWLQWCWNDLIYTCLTSPRSQKLPSLFHTLFHSSASAAWRNSRNFSACPSF